MYENIQDTHEKKFLKDTKGNVFHIYWLEELIFPYYSKLSTNSLQSLSKLQGTFHKT